MKKIDLNKISKDVLDNYTSSVSYVEECIDENFEVIIDYISKIKGRVIITGIGKSAIIGMKITQLLVIDDGNYKGMIHMHELLKAGL